MSNSSIDRRSYLAGMATASAVGLAGCSSSDDAETEETETETLATQVTDQPGDIADFESCLITIVGMWLGTDDAEADDEDADNEDGAGVDDENSHAEADDEDADNEDTDSDGREYYEYDEPETADLVQLQGENTQLVDERELDLAEYEFLQLDTDGVEATLNDGGWATVEVPGNAPLTFNEPFEVRADTRTTFTADFTPVKRGQAGGYILQPVAQGTTVSYEPVEESDDESDEE